MFHVQNDVRLGRFFEMTMDFKGWHEEVQTIVDALLLPSATNAEFKIEEVSSGSSIDPAKQSRSTNNHLPMEMESLSPSSVCSMNASFGPRGNLKHKQYIAQNHGSLKRW